MVAIYIPCLICQFIRPAIVVTASLNLSPGLRASVCLCPHLLPCLPVLKGKKKLKNQAITSGGNEKSKPSSQLPGGSWQTSAWG